MQARYTPGFPSSWIFEVGDTPVQVLKTLEEALEYRYEAFPVLPVKVPKLAYDGGG